MVSSLSELPDDCLAEVFVRLPADDPPCLLRAGLTEKNFHRILSSPVFHVYHRQLHPTPSVVGFLYDAKGDATYGSCFVPNNPASGRPAARDFPGRRVLDCRHGRALFLEPSRSLGTERRYHLVVSNILTNEDRFLPPPPPAPPLAAVSTSYMNAAVLCSAAVGGCDHRSCHGGPFRVAVVCLVPDVMSARVYEYDSETGNWSEPVSAQYPDRFMYMTPHPSTLVGNTLYFRCGYGYALEYQLGVQHLSFIQGPPIPVSPMWAIWLMPMSMEDGGGLGCMYVEEDELGLRLRLWSREAAHGVARWTRGRAIELENLLPDAALQSLQSASASSSPKLQLVGSAEATNVIFLGTWSRNHPDAIYMVELDSARAKKLFDGSTTVVPYSSFCIPVPAPV